MLTTNETVQVRGFSLIITATFDAGVLESLSARGGRANYLFFAQAAEGRLEGAIWPSGKSGEGMDHTRAGLPSEFRAYLDELVAAWEDAGEQARREHEEEQYWRSMAEEYGY